MSLSTSRWFSVIPYKRTRYNSQLSEATMERHEYGLLVEPLATVSKPPVIPVSQVSRMTDLKEALLAYEGAKRSHVRINPGAASVTPNPQIQSDHLEYDITLLMCL